MVEKHGLTQTFYGLTLKKQRRECGGRRVKLSHEFARITRIFNRRGRRVLATDFGSYCVCRISYVPSTRLRVNCERRPMVGLWEAGEKGVLLVIKRQKMHKKKQK